MLKKQYFDFLEVANISPQILLEIFIVTVTITISSMGISSNIWGKFLRPKNNKKKWKHFQLSLYRIYYIDKRWKFQRPTPPIAGRCMVWAGVFIFPPSWGGNTFFISPPGVRILGGQKLGFSPPDPQILGGQKSSNLFGAQCEWFFLVPFPLCWSGWNLQPS